jgi:hypothetical protein
MPLSRLSYISEFAWSWGRGSINSQFNAILRASVRNNERIGITGALLLEDGFFLQVLEGQHDALLAMMARIRVDERHRNIEIRTFVPVVARAFNGWWMACAERNSATDALFAPYTGSGRFDARSLTAGDIMHLLTGIERIGFANERVPLALHVC